MSNHNLDILNSMEVLEYDTDGGVLIYCLVANTPENKKKLVSIGVPAEEIEKAVGKDGTDIDISGFGFRYGGAQWFDGSKWLSNIPLEVSHE